MIRIRVQVALAEDAVNPSMGAFRKHPCFRNFSKNHLNSDTPRIGFKLCYSLFGGVGREVVKIIMKIKN